jgi:hypothetical protein
MTEMGSERPQFALRYSKLSDEALKELASDAANLTNVAREALLAELAKRGIEIELPTGANSVDEQVKHSGPLVMVKRFRDLPEAFVARSILDSAEIDSFLADGNLVRIDWLYSNLIGGAKLMVKPEDFEEAVKLLEESAEIGAQGQGEAENENH